MKNIRLSEADLARIVKRVINEEESTIPACTADMYAKGGTIFISNEELQFSYPSGKRCIIMGNSLEVSNLSVKP
jgi:hypothetical protein